MATEADKPLSIGNRQPLVTVGIPIYNSADHIGRTLDSLLAQDYRNLEIILSDDASTDGSADLCRSYASTYPNVTALCAKTNLGTVRNTNRLFDMRNGDFFMWPSHNDRFAPSYVRRCVEVLLNDSTTAVCYTRTRLENSSGKAMSCPDKLDTRGLNARQRMRTLISDFTYGNMYYGVFRASMLAKTGLLPACWGPDSLLFAELSLHGAIAQIDEELFYRHMDDSEDEASRTARWCNVLGLSPMERQFLLLNSFNGYMEMVQRLAMTDAEKSVIFADALDTYAVRHASGIRKEAAALAELAAAPATSAPLSAIRHLHYCQLALLLLDAANGRETLGTTQQQYAAILNGQQTRLNPDMFLRSTAHRVRLQTRHLARQLFARR